MYKADEKNDSDFKAWRSKNKLVRIWKTAIVKSGKRTGRFVYDFRVTSLQTSRTLLDKSFTSMSKATKYAKSYMKRH